MIRRLWTGALASAFLVAGAVACSDDETEPDLETEFEASLTGAAERPTPVTTTATGTATVDIDDDNSTMTFNVTVTGLVSPTMAHIHTGTTSEAGPIVVNLLPTAPAAGTFTGTLASGTIQASAILNGETFATLAAKIRSGNAYVNVHTVANPNGELRGQLMEDN